MQVLKVEVGCDGDTTQGAEQSHMRHRGDNSSTAFDRGYENWFMVEAKKRSDGTLVRATLLFSFFFLFCLIHPAPVHPIAVVTRTCVPLRR